MTIRAIFMALTIPLFLLMAAVNGAALYFQEQSEISRALTDQTRAAAIVAAEFVAEIDDPLGKLTQPKRQNAIDAAVAHIKGIQGLYLVEKSGAITPLMAGSSQWSPIVNWMGEEAVTESFQTDNPDGGFFVAIHPAGDGRAVAARIDAAPLMTNQTQMIRMILYITLGVGAFAAALSLFVAHRISCELRWYGESSGSSRATETTNSDTRFRIRETRDLSDAMRLMQASRDAAESRHQRDAARSDSLRDIDSASKQLHGDVFPSVALETAGTSIAVRVCGTPPSGTFYAAISEKSGEAHVVVGRCRATGPDTDLANAAAARHFIEGNLKNLGQETCLSLARRAFEIETLELLSWHSGIAKKECQKFMCAASEGVTADAKRIVAHHRDLTPNQTLTAIVSLLNPTGIFVAIGPSTLH